MFIEAKGLCKWVYIWLKLIFHTNLGIVIQKRKSRIPRPTNQNIELALSVKRKSGLKLGECAC
jgi:hypothetical protein